MKTLTFCWSLLRSADPVIRAILSWGTLAIVLWWAVHLIFHVDRFGLTQTVAFALAVGLGYRVFKVIFRTELSWVKVIHAVRPAAFIVPAIVGTRLSIWVLYTAAWIYLFADEWWMTPIDLARFAAPDRGFSRPALGGYQAVATAPELPAAHGDAE